MPLVDILFIYPAESEGFEPPVRRNAYTAFRVRHFRPLSQLSFAFFAKKRAKLQQIFYIRKYFSEIMIFMLKFAYMQKK